MSVSDGAPGAPDRIGAGRLSTRLPSVVNISTHAAQGSEFAAVIVAVPPLVAAQVAPVMTDAVPLPILRKDFLLDERDVYEARLAGAASGAAGIPRVLEAQPPRTKSPATAAAQIEAFIWFCSLCTSAQNLASSLRRAHAVARMAALLSREVPGDDRWTTDPTAG